MTTDVWGDVTGAPVVRADLADVEPYVSPQLPARVRLNTNESPYPPPPGLLEELGERVRELALNRYPDRDAHSLLHALAEAEDWSPEGIWIANGSNEVFLHLLLAFGGAGRSSLTFEPTYSLHTLIPRIAGTETAQVARTDRFVIDLDAAVDEMARRRPDVVIVCSPNNPSGACEPLDVIGALCENTRGLVIVDEAYGDFAPKGASARDLVNEHANLVVTRTLSKAWRLAGARIGYALARPETIAGLARVRLPYHLSALTQAVGLAALARPAEMLEAVGAIVRERERLSIELQALGLKTYRSDANFVLFEVDDPDEVWRELLDRDVLIRNYSGQAGLARCMRVTAGLPDETDEFIATLRQVLA